MSGTILSGSEALDAMRQVDFVAPHSYSANVRLGVNGPEAYLSIMSQMAIDAAVTVAEHHPGSAVVVTGETCYGDTLPTTTELIADRATGVLGVPNDRVLPLKRPDGRGLDNTYLQTEALAKFFDQDSEKRALIVPLGYHLRRIVHTAKAYGIEADFVAAEDVLHAIGDDSYDKYLPRIQELEISEKALRVINLFDRKGKLLNLLMRTTGPRLVDVVESDGGLKLESGHSGKKLKNLTQKATA